MRTVCLGDTSGDLTVIDIFARSDRHLVAKCKCKCGSEITVPRVVVAMKARTACRKCDTAPLVGRRFGSLVVLRERKDGDCDEHHVIVRCDCGAEKQIQRSNLLNGRALSCGCKTAGLISAGKKIHGQSTKGGRSNAFIVWTAMLQRCYNKNRPEYHRYGGRGITVCKRWRESVVNFIADMGKRPTENHSLDRINNDGNYEPGNCRWATMLQQCNNTHRTRRFALNGREYTLREWAAQTGMNPKLIDARIRMGWSVNRAFTTPVKSTKR